MLDSLYAQVMRVRRRRYEREPTRQRRLSKPVISVGNLSMGGTGKTPVVAAVAQWLLDRGERPSILSRGYARATNVDGVVVVSDGVEVRASVDRAGDEPMMLARQVPRAVVCVSPERYLSGVLAERQLGATVHVLDDGFQHLELARDLDILVTTIGEIPNGKVMPRGRLREPIEAAARAQVLVVSDATAGAAASEAWTLGISQACGAARTLGEPAGIREFGAGGREPGAGSEDPGAGSGDPGAGIRNRRVMALAGIAKPERFIEALKLDGWNVVDAITFADHHRYSRRDIAAVADRVRSVGADAVLTTDKDAVRLDVIEQIPFPLYRVPLSITFDPPDVLFQSVAAVLP